MNEKLYQANVELVDENRVLKEDKKILQNRINKAIEYIEDIAPWEEITEEGEKVSGKLLLTDHIDYLIQMLKGEW